MNQATREGLAYVLRRMEDELQKAHAEREQLEASLTRVNGQIAELERRRRDINDDLLQ